MPFRLFWISEWISGLLLLFEPFFLENNLSGLSILTLCVINQDLSCFFYIFYWVSRVGAEQQQQSLSGGAANWM